MHGMKFQENFIYVSWNPLLLWSSKFEVGSNDFQVGNFPTDWIFVSYSCPSNWNLELMIMFAQRQRQKGNVISILFIPLEFILMLFPFFAISNL